jgi:hypothetical protein
MSSHGIQDRRDVSFVTNVYFLLDGFPTQPPQSSSSHTPNASINRDSTVLNAKPSTRLHGRVSWLSWNPSGLLLNANVERDNSRSKEVSTPF